MRIQSPENTSPIDRVSKEPRASRLRIGLPLHLPQALTVFRHRNFRLFFFGQLISVIGSWMQTTALQWLVYSLTNSQSSLGLVTFLNFLPVLLVSLLMGVLVDRLPKRRILLFTQSWFMLLAVVLAVLTFSGVITYWMILLLAFMVGIGNALDMPARQAFYVDLVDRTELTSAIGLNSALFNAARIIGPAIAGLIVGTIGEAPAFAINAITFLAVIVALLMMRLNPVEKTIKPQKGLSDLRQGVQYMLHEKTILGLVVMVALFSLVGAPYMVLLPVYARDILMIGAEGYGQLLSAQGIGALLGAFGVIFFGNYQRKGRAVLFSRFLLGIGLIGLAFSRHPLGSMLALVVAGYGFITQLILTNSLIQFIVPDELRGRVLSAYTWALGGFFPLGSLLMGVIGDRISAPSTALLMGFGCVVLTVVNLIVFPGMKKLI
jgi:predicted MFS family arabinose efflux permease